MRPSESASAMQEGADISTCRVQTCYFDNLLIQLKVDRDHFLILMRGKET